MSIVIAIIIFSIIILFHELGHFLLAKANGVQVNEFCLGLGPTIVGFTRGETKYSLKLLPFGGACMMEGEDDDSTNDRAFNKKGVWQRFSIVAAGPVFNFIMAWVFSVILLGCAGYDLPNLYQVSDGSPAAEAGLQAGDTIVKLNHKNIHFFREISVFTYFHEGETVDVTYVRDGEKHTVSITPEYSKDTKSYLFGFVGSGVNTRGNVLQVLKYSFLEVHYWICTMLESLKMMFTGHVSLNDVSGPVGIVKTIGDTYTESMLDGIYYAVMNLLKSKYAKA